MTLFSCTTAYVNYLNEVPKYVVAGLRVTFDR
jgi:hypothetical protein